MKSRAVKEVKRQVCVRLTEHRPCGKETCRRTEGRRRCPGLSEQQQQQQQQPRDPVNIRSLPAACFMTTH